MHDHIIRAVDGVDLYVDRGENLGVVGESGCGKSVMMLSTMKLIPDPPGRIESGKILLEGEDIVEASVERMRTGA
jgi:ABC-type dipeptide/oligopeptide/nickel transport system ATPase component